MIIKWLLHEEVKVYRSLAATDSDSDSEKTFCYDSDSDSDSEKNIFADSDSDSDESKSGFGVLRRSLLRSVLLKSKRKNYVQRSDTIFWSGSHARKLIMRLSE